MKSLSPSQPHVIAMVGVPGSGKTFFAEKFSQTFNAPHISGDALLGVIGENPSAIKAIIDRQLDELLKTKQSIVLEGYTESRSDRTELAQRAKKAGYQPLFVWVQTDQTTAEARSQKSGKSKEFVNFLLKRFSPPHSSERPIVISGRHTYAGQARTVLKKLSAPRADASAHPTPPVRTVHDIHRAR